MSALAKFRSVAGIDAASRVKKFQNALSASDSRRARLDEALESAVASFNDTADVGARTAAEDAVAAEVKAHKAIVEGLEAAQKDLATEQAEEAAKQLAAKHASLRVEAKRFGETITEKLVELGKLLGSHEGIVDQLPAGDRYTNWPQDYLKSANDALAKSSPPRMTKAGGLSFVENPPRIVDLQLVCPMEKVD